MAAPLRRSARPLVGSLLLLTLGTGCRVTGVAVDNLDATLSSSDNFRYQGRVTNVWRDLLQNGLGGILSGAFSVEMRQPKVTAIPNPTEFALEQLLELEGSRQGADAWRHNEQVRVFARYAATAPSQLLRERALLALVPHASRLGVEDLPPADRAPAANAPELLEALDGLVDATKRIVAERDEPSATALADFDAAIDVLAAADVDIEGGSRLLRALAPFLDASRLPAVTKERLNTLSLDTQRGLVAEALRRGLSDRSSVARAGAFGACIEIFGDAFAIEAVLACAGRDAVADALGDRFSRFDVPQVPAAYDEVHIVVAEHFEAQGLPGEATAHTAPALRLRGSIFAALTRLAADDFLFDVSTRQAAMAALTGVSGGELDTLRVEEWAEWFRERTDELQSEIERLEGAPGTGPS